MAEDGGKGGGGAPGLAATLERTVSRFLGAPYRPGKLAPEHPDKDTRNRMLRRLMSVETVRQQNVEAVVTSAFVEASGLAGGVNETVAYAWLARFFDAVKEIRDPGLQALWGKVLAAETAVPGTHDLHMMRVLADLEAEDVGRLSRMSRIAFPTGYLIKIGGRNEFEPFQLTDEDLARLQGLDLLQEVDDLGVTYYAPTRGLTLDFPGADLIVRHPARTLFTFDAFKLTGAGLAIMNRTAEPRVDVEYLRALGASLKRDGFDYRVRLADGQLVQ